MTRRYYSSRTKGKSLTLEELYWKLQNLYLLFLGRDFFKEKLHLRTTDHLPDITKQEAALVLPFQPFPIEKWPKDTITEDHIFDTLEFLYDHVSKPGEMVDISDAGFCYSDYDGYDDKAGQEEFRSKANIFLAEYKTGYELTKDGIILALGTDGLQHILSADIIPYDEANVDSKVRNAIEKWRNRRLDLSERKEAIRELADVFEWLKKTKSLDTVLDGKDEAAIFDIANNFGIRHHNPKQKTNYDPEIWYSWIFHFYLATYHASIRLLIKKEKAANRPKNQTSGITKPRD